MSMFEGAVHENYASGIFGSTTNNEYAENGGFRIYSFKNTGTFKFNQV